MSLIGFVRRRGELRVETYRSYGAPEAMSFTGRVLANRVVAAATEVEGRRHTMLRMIRRFLTREVAGVRVVVERGGQSTTVVSSSEGYFQANLDVSGQIGPWVEARASIAESDERHDGDHTWPAHSVVVDETLERLLISDVDDTVLANAAGRTFGTIWMTLTGSVMTRKPVDGAPELYRKLTSTGAPVVYVSSSPWNLHSFLTAFLERHRFPRGPLVLRDFGLNRATLGSSSHGSHKAHAIASILELCPNAQVVLIGDTSQQDPAAFAQIATEHPQQVRAIFLRDVGDEDKAAAARQLGHGTVATNPDLVYEIVGSMTEVAPILQIRTSWFADSQ